MKLRNPLKDPRLSIILILDEGDRQFCSHQKSKNWINCQSLRDLHGKTSSGYHWRVAEEPEMGRFRLRNRWVHQTLPLPHRPELESLCRFLPTQNRIEAHQVCPRNSRQRIRFPRSNRLLPQQVLVLISPI